MHTRDIGLPSWSWKIGPWGKMNPVAFKKPMDGMDYLRGKTKLAKQGKRAVINMNPSRQRWQKIQIRQTSQSYPEVKPLRPQFIKRAVKFGKLIFCKLTCCKLRY